MKIIVYGFLQKKKKKHASFFSWNHESEMINSNRKFHLHWRISIACNEKEMYANIIIVLYDFIRR